MCISGAVSVGASARETHQVSALTGLFDDDLLHFFDIFPEGLVIGVDFGKVMGIGMDPYTVAGGGLLSYSVFIHGKGVRHKEGRLHSVTVQDVQKVLCVFPGAVVKSQVDDLSGRFPVLVLRRILTASVSGIISRTARVSIFVFPAADKYIIAVFRDSRLSGFRIQKRDLSVTHRDIPRLVSHLIDDEIPVL